MAAQARVHRLVDVAPVFPGQSPGRSKGAIDAQRGRIELDMVRVGSGAETQSIIVALIEHAERGDLAAGLPADRERACGEPSRGTQLAGDAAGHHTRERGHFKIRIAVAQSPRNGQCDALGLTVDREDHSASGARFCLEGLRLVLVFQPAHLVHDALYGLEIAVVVVVENLYCHAAHRLPGTATQWNRPADTPKPA